MVRSEREEERLALEEACCLSVQASNSSVLNVSKLSSPLAALHYCNKLVILVIVVSF